MSKSLFWQLEKLGRTRLSKSYQFRQFLSSEIATAFGLPNIPDDPDLAIYAGERLCELILEPLTDRFGPLIIRSGFRSARINAVGAAEGLMCASNKKNYSYHIWDHRDADGHIGAAACILIPAFNAAETDLETWQDLALWIDANLPYHRLTFFKRDNAFNIGWHENPRREIFSRNPEPHWFYPEKH
ncbi:hypothetical protein J7481_22865 [Labrenzia sp. R4_2]|uniref:hypothetical protein n=1 Tax=Labrenzia sp. R4_2 TaxID=2821107 RepID=UPI001AD95D80|nr:hypothetical protein [Labrenzia sp. R4_2]MBO9422371.1 hypothetical protein [Labrenzia sp. R4_2]